MQALKAIKAYIASPPVLNQLGPIEDLFLYLVASTAFASAALVRQDGNGQQSLVYFISKTWANNETQYMQ